MSTVINLYGGPGCGKSTSAAYLYYVLKSRGVNAELVREYVKDWAWEKRQIGTYDQLYFSGKQIRKEALLLGKADVIVTDSPVLIGAYYAGRYASRTIAAGCVAMAKAFYEQARADGHRYEHVVLRRTKAYNPAGRYQTEEQAREIDDGLRTLLSNAGMSFWGYDTDEESLLDLIDVLVPEAGDVAPSDTK